MQSTSPPGKALSVLLALALACAPLEQAAAGDLQAEVNKMFDDLGAMGNVTAPGAFRGQAYNTYTGGNLFLRTPNKVYQIGTMQFPYAKASCGGIDVFGGSFSHISAAEFKAMLKNLTAALPGVAFQLALSSVSPLLGQKVEWIKSLETFINNARINSCETSSALVNSAASAMGLDAFTMCTRIAVTSGLEPDEDAARRRCGPAQQAAVLKAAREGGDADAKALAPFVGNLTWAALKRVTTIDDQERELIMSMVGTVIFYPDLATQPKPVPATLTKISELLYGASDAGGGKVNVMLLKCNNYDACDDPQPRTDVHTPFTRKVETIMHSLAQKIRDGGPAPTQQEAGFINSTSEPVYRMLSVGAIIPGSSLTEQMIAIYRDPIAAEYAHNFLDRSLRGGLDALARDFSLDKEKRESSRELRERTQAYLSDLAREKATLQQKLQSLSVVATEMERIERQLKAQMPQHILDMLAASVGRTSR